MCIQVQSIVDQHHPDAKIATKVRFQEPGMENGIDNKIEDEPTNEVINICEHFINTHQHFQPVNEEKIILENSIKEKDDISEKEPDSVLSDIQTDEEKKPSFTPYVIY